MPTTAVLFDLDGTLIDTNYLHVTAWWETFAAAGHEVSMVDIHHRIGMGSDQLLDALLPGRDPDRDDELLAGHRERYQPYWKRLRPFPAARELVRTLADRGSAVSLCTSAGPEELAVLREVLDVEDALTTVTGAGEGTAKPAPDLVAVALERMAVDPQQAVFVGDTVWDVQASRRAGLRCVGVGTGGIGAEQLTAEGAVAVYPDVAALLAGLGSSPLG
jgi:HAD superfamily hydrolase (TIGR01509 family)